MSIYDTDAHFTVVCKRCNKKIEVIRNFGGGIRRQDKPCNHPHSNPAICDCGSRQLEVY